ncbi:MAG TPA: nuclear transport factor 2 family protein [Holophaga sp.]|nr:nuclear transport factor 2 family protein [Holophaga sp.]
MRSSSWFLIPFLACHIAGAQALSKAETRDATAAVAATLDDWHLAAAQGDEGRYFGRMAPEAVFVGTDPDERWTKEEFRQWAHPGFAAHRIWVFKALRRNIALSPSGDVAWFDEALDTNSMGKARGSGVLRKEGGSWLITQYVLSLPIPRAVFREVRQMITLLESPSKKTQGEAPTPGGK